MKSKGNNLHYFIRANLQKTHTPMLQPIGYTHTRQPAGRKVQVIQFKHTHSDRHSATHTHHSTKQHTHTLALKNEGESTNKITHTRKPS